MKKTKLLTHKWNKTEKGLQYNYISRRIKKREKRNEWISTINSGTRSLSNSSYSQIIHQLKFNNILINKKMLAELIKSEPLVYKNVIN